MEGGCRLVLRRLQVHIRGRLTGGNVVAADPGAHQRKKAYARRKEEERWVKAAGEVKTVYRCICDKNLEMFKAEEHLKRIKTT